MEAASSRRYSLQKTILRDSRIPTSSSTTSNRGELMRCEQLKLTAIDCLTQYVTKLSVRKRKFGIIASTHRVAKSSTASKTTECWRSRRSATFHRSEVPSASVRLRQSGFTAKGVKLQSPFFCCRAAISAQREGLATWREQS